MKRFWVGWTSRHEGVDTPFSKWTVRAVRAGGSEPGKTYSFTYHAVIDAPDREQAWQKVVALYPDAEEHFVRGREQDYWPPQSRYPKAS